MATYIARRLLWLPCILLIASFVTFVLGRYGPGDPVEVIMGQYNNPAAVERMIADTDCAVIDLDDLEDRITHE